MRGSNNHVRGFDHGNAAPNDDGGDNAWWAASPAQAGARVVATNRLLEEADGGTSTKSTR